MAKSLIMLAIDRVAEETPSALKILVRPWRSVFASAPFAAGGLALAPQTSRFLCFATPAGSAADIDSPVDVGGNTVYVQSLVKADADIP